MDTAEIEVFLALAEELHFGRTAERLRLPQPRVSRLVARFGADRQPRVIEKYRTPSGDTASAGSQAPGEPDITAGALQARPPSADRANPISAA